MIRVNPTVAEVIPYVSGRPIEEVAREFGIEEVIKLASNESPVSPFPEVSAVIGDLASRVNRYPDSNCYLLTKAASEALSIPEENLWFGAGSSSLLREIANSVGGVGTSAVFAEPSFALYKIITWMASARPISVPVDKNHRHDFETMLSEIDETTTVVYVCNPNNPTGTMADADAVDAFISAVPPNVLVVVDEAYNDFADDFRSAIPHALERGNVVVLRTFSKIYGLAGLRIGYAIANGAVLTELRKSQTPFTVTQLAQDAAIEALKFPSRVEERRTVNAAGRSFLASRLRRAGLDVAESQTNFVYFHLGDEQDRVNQALLEQGVIIRMFGAGWARISVGTEGENRRAVESIAALVAR
jgi:histidinol-phosphate aminotransferase